MKTEKEPVRQKTNKENRSNSWGTQIISSSVSALRATLVVNYITEAKKSGC